MKAGATGGSPEVIGKVGRETGVLDIVAGLDLVIGDLQGRARRGS
jgi:hypothetical protein